MDSACKYPNKPHNNFVSHKEVRMILNEILQELQGIRIELVRIRQDIKSMKYVANMPVQLDGPIMTQACYEACQRELQRRASMRRHSGR